MDRISALIGWKIVQVQLKVAEKLNTWERKCSVKQKKIYLCLFLILGTAYSSYLLTDALIRDNSKTEKIWDTQPNSPTPLIPGILDTMGSRSNEL